MHQNFYVVDAPLWMRQKIQAFLKVLQFASTALSIPPNVFFQLCLSHPEFRVCINIFQLEKSIFASTTQRQIPIFSYQYAYPILNSASTSTIDNLKSHYMHQQHRAKFNIFFTHAYSLLNSASISTFPNLKIIICINSTEPDTNIFFPICLSPPEFCVSINVFQLEILF